MLSRSSSDAGVRLRRAKSSSSVHSRRTNQSVEYVDPEIAQRNAHIAALHAYENAYGRRPDMTSTPGKAPVRRATQAQRNAEGSHFLQRRESGARMRSSNASAKRPSTAMLSKRDKDSTVDGSVDGRSNIKSHDLSKAASHNLNRASSEIETIMPPLPRGVRKAQSSQDFSDHSAANHKERMLHEYVQSQRTIAYDNPDAIHTIQSIAEYDEPAGRERTFSSFLGQDKVFGQDPEDAGEPDEKVVRKRTSFISNPLTSRRGRVHVHDPVHTTTTSTTTYNERCHSTTEVLTASHLPTHDTPQAPKNRAISLSFKGIVKRVFRKSSQTKTPEPLPQQQVEASKPHFGDQWETVPTFPAHSSSDQRIAESILARARSQTPSFGRMPPAVEGPSGPRSREVSGESDKTATRTKSRVTSWADSTHDGTVASRKTLKRLSVIDELGLQQSDRRASVNGRSPSPLPMTNSLLGRKIYDRIMNKSSEAPAATENENLLEPLSEPTNGPSQSSAEPQSTSLAVPKSVYENLPSQQRRVSSFASKAKEAAKSTIRAVTPSSRRTSGRTDCQGATTPTPFTDHDFDNDDTLIDIMPGELSSPRKHSKDSVADDTKPSLEKIPKIVAESHDKEQPMSEKNRTLHAPVSSRDFASADTEVYKSVFADALASKESTAVPKISSKNELDGVLSHIDRRASRGDTTGTISPSLYSRATDESPEKKPPDTSAMSTPTARRGGSLAHDGTAVVLPSYRFPTSASPKRQQNKPIHGTRSSRDWRYWLSQELAEFDRGEHEGNNENRFSLNQEFITLSEDKKSDEREYLRVMDSMSSLPGPSTSNAKSGHVREQAQINGSDEYDSILGLYSASRQVSGHEKMSTIRKVTASSVTEESLVDKVQQVDSAILSRPPLVERTSSRMNDRFPMLDTGRPPSRANAQRSQSSLSARRPSAASQQRATSAASQTRAPSAASMRTFKNKQVAPLKERNQSSSYGTQANTSSSSMLVVPENDLYQEPKRPKSMIPLRAGSGSAALNANTENPRSFSRTPPPSYILQTENNPFVVTPRVSSKAATPTISISTPSQHSPSKHTMNRTSSTRLSLMPHVVPPSPFATGANSSPRRARSDLDLHSNPSGNSTIDPEPGQSVRRKPLSAVRQNLYEDTTMRRIAEGPYARTNSPVYLATSKENTPSPAKSLRLKGSRGAMNSGSPSGGQRMADEFLKRRMGGGVYGVAGSAATSERETGSQTDSPITPGFI